MSEEELLVIEDSIEGMNLEEMMNFSSGPEEGKIIEVPVVEVGAQHVVVDLGLKSEGVISIEEFFGQEVRAGEIISVFLQSREGEDGHPVISYRQAQRMKNWENISDIFQKNVGIEGIVSGKVRGGFIVDLGESAFLPSSQVLPRRKERFESIIGKKIWVKILEFDRKKRNIVVSQRKYWEDINEKKRAELMTKIQENAIIEGKVSGITSFGAFVDIGGVEGLVHISDISWNRIGKVEDILKIGQTVTVKVMKYDDNMTKIALSLKELTPHPWQDIETKFPAGKIIPGKVTSLTPFGAFVEIEEGVEGLLHISEISWTENVKHPQEVLSVGQVLNLRILNVNREEEKISLSLKKAEDNPWDEIKLKYPSGSKVKGTVTSLLPFGAFVKLPEGLEGLIHISDFSWLKKIRHPQEMLEVGEEVESVVIEVNPVEEKIVLGLKQMIENPFLKYETGNNVKGKVRKITDFGVFVELEPEIEGIIRTNELSIHKFQHPKEVVQEGEIITAKVIKSDSEERKILLSIKKYEKEKEKEEIQKYLNLGEERITLGEIVKDKTE